jgi:peptidoglycan/LPS O-acetylase OafA/YrhL
MMTVQQRFTQSNTPRRGDLPALTGLRFLAALHVVFYHEALSLIPGGWVRQLISGGFISVSLFFVLSGFVMAYTYLEPFNSRAVGLESFWMARFARVYPVYVLALVFALPVYVPWALRKFAEQGLIGPTKAIFTFVANITLLEAWVPQTVAPWNSPGWSLSVEALFYLAFPFFAPALSRERSASVVFIAASCWLAGIAVATIFTAAHPTLWSGGEPEFTVPGLVVLKYFPLMHVAEFLIGVSCGLLYLRASAARTQKGADAGLLSVLVAAAVVLVLSIPQQLPFPLLHSGLLAPLFGILIFSLATGGGPLAQLLQTPQAVLLGKASYAIYLFHEPLATILYKRQWSPLRATPPYARFGVYLTILIAFSIAVLVWYEEPARRAIRHRRIRPITTG